MWIVFNLTPLKITFLLLSLKVLFELLHNNYDCPEFTKHIFFEQFQLILEIKIIFAPVLCNHVFMSVGNLTNSRSTRS